MIKHVKADSLASVFVDSSLSTFTQHAIDNGVTQNSIIYITCDDQDIKFGRHFKNGSTWIWTWGELYGNATIPITNEEIDAIFDEPVIVTLPQNGTLVLNNIGQVSNGILNLGNNARYNQGVLYFESATWDDAYQSNAEFNDGVLSCGDSISDGTLYIKNATVTSGIMYLK